MGSVAEPEHTVKLIYSAEVLDKELLRTAEDFTTCLQPEIATALFGKSGMVQLAAARRAVEERLASPFSIMVAGDFKRGKSTLINALVGQAVAPVDVQPETISINRIEYAAEFVARIQSQDGGEAIIAREDLKRERLQPLLRGLAAPLRHLRVGAPSEMLRQVTLIDTPGLGDMFQQFEQTVREYIELADTIVYVLSSTSPLSQTEQEFLLDTVAPRHFPKMFFVVNAMDLMATGEDEQRLMGQVREKLNRTMPGSSVYGISALDEWSRVSGGARPNPARAESLERLFGAFRRDLDEAIQFRRRYYVLDRAAFAFGETVELAERRAAGVEAALEHSQEQLAAGVRAIEEGQQSRSKELQATRDALASGFERLRGQAEGWMSEFIDRIQNEVIEALRKFQTRQIRQQFAFFLRDRVRRAIEACVAAHQPEITALMEEYAAGVEADAAALQVRFGSAMLLPDRWSKLQTAQWVAQYLMLTPVIQLGLALFTRQHSNVESGQIVDDIARGIPQLREDVRAQVRQVYQNVQDKLLAEWTRRYQEEMQARLGDLKRAEELRESGSQRVEQAKTKLSEVRELTAAQKVFLDRFKERVWAGIDAAASAN